MDIGMPILIGNSVRKAEVRFETVRSEDVATGKTVTREP